MCNKIHKEPITINNISANNLQAKVEQALSCDQKMYENAQLCYSFRRCELKAQCDTTETTNSKNTKIRNTDKTEC